MWLADRWWIFDISPGANQGEIAQPQNDEQVLESVLVRLQVDPPRRASTH